MPPKSWRLLASAGLDMRRVSIFGTGLDKFDEAGPAVGRYRPLLALCPGLQACTPRWALCWCPVFQLWFSAACGDLDWLLISMPGTVLRKEN